MIRYDYEKSGKKENGKKYSQLFYMRDFFSLVSFFGLT